MCLPGEGTDACEIRPGGTCNRQTKKGGAKSSPKGTKTSIASAVYTLLCQLATGRKAPRNVTVCVTAWPRATRREGPINLVRRLGSPHQVLIHLLSYLRFKRALSRTAACALGDLL